MKLLTMSGVSFRVMLLMALVPILFLNCAPTVETGKAPTRNFQSYTSYASYLAAINGTPEEGEGQGAIPVEGLPAKKVAVAIVPVNQCVAGELDMLRYAHQCAQSVPLVVSMIDGAGEKVVSRRTAYRNIVFNQFLLEISTQQLVDLKGNEVDILICLDANNNGLCSDEPVKNVNEVSGQLAPVIQKYNETGMITCDPALTQKIVSGMVMYHRHHQFSGTQSAKSKALSDYMTGQVRSMNGANDVDVLADGTTRVRMNMVQFDNTTCPPPPQKRTNGCFARDTQIRTASRGDVAIDLLMPGEKLVLADGRTGSIKSIIAGPEKMPLVVFETATGQKVRVTSTHPMKTDQGIKAAYQVSIGEKLMIADGTYATLKNVSREAYTDLVYNVELSGPQEADHLVIANGIVSGDLYLQRALSGKQELRLSLLEEAHLWINTLTRI